MGVTVRVRVGAAVLPPPPPPASVLYGPAGYWPAHTAAYETPATTRVSSWPAVRNAVRDLASASGPVVVELADGGDWSSPGLPATAGMDGRSSNILIRPANPAGLVTDLGDISCSRVTLAGFIGSWALRAGDQAAIVRHTIRRTQQVIIGHGLDGDDGPSGYQILDLASPVRDVAAGDRLHVEGGRDGLWRGGWTMGKLRPDGSGSHVDTLQITGHTGFLRFEHWFFGHAADSATIIAGWEQQGSVPMPDITFDTVYSQQKDADKGNDILVKVRAGGSWTWRNVRSDGTLNMNIPSSGASYDPPCPVEFDNVAVRTLKFTDSARKGHNLSLPGVTTGASPAVPEWLRPAWWSDLREAA